MEETRSNYDLQVDIAKKIFLEYDQDALIQKFGLSADEKWICLDYLGIPCRISREDGSIQEYRQDQWQACRRYSTVMTIYDLLCFSKGDTSPVLAGQWCAVGHFVVTGITETETFTRKFATRIDGRAEQLKAACQKLGGVLLPRMAGADVTCRFAVTTFFPVLLQFWEGDEEFVPRLLLLWDQNTHHFLHFETTFYLQGDLLERLYDCMEEIA